MRAAFPTLVISALLALLLSPVCAFAQEAVSPPNDFFRLGIRGGVQAFSYQEKLGAVKSDYDSYGAAVGVNASLRIPSTRFRLAVDYLGSFITDDREKWENLDTILGPATGTQRNDLDVDLHVFDFDLGYALVKQENFEWWVVGGWHYYIENFTRSNFFITAGGTIFGALDATVTEDVTGQGVKLGTAVEARIAPRLLIDGGVAGYYLYDVDVKNSLLGRVDSDGHAFRWRIALDYLLVKDSTIGVGYEGHFIHVDRGTSAIAILPENETWAHTVTLRLGVRF